eukprot:UN15963
MLFKKGVSLCKNHCFFPGNVFLNLGGCVLTDTNVYD